MTDAQLQRKLKQLATRKAKNAAQDSAELKSYVRVARARGWSLRRIAESAGMSAQNVALLVGKAK